MIFIDTNYFLRLLLQDDDNQHKKAEKLFLEAAEGKVLVFTSIIVIFEIYWVLKSHYKKTNRQIYEFLTKGVIPGGFTPFNLLSDGSK